MNVRTLFEDQIIKVAEQPKDNTLPNSGEHKLLLIPIDHDYPGGSAAMHNAVFRRFLPNYQTVFVVADPKNADLLMETFRQDPSYIGGGIGSGFKDKVGPLLDELDDSAKITGSVNVIKKENNKLIGYNTDGVGFLKGLESEYSNAVKNQYIVILGAGGTTLPVAYELAQKQPKKLVILNRTVSKAKNIAQLLSTYVPTDYGGEDRIGSELAQADLVINTSNKGAHPFEKYSAFSPITDDFDQDIHIAQQNLSRLKKNAIVADILLEDDSPTLKMARNAGYKTHNGKNMNLYQAVPALQIMAPLNHIDPKTLEQVMRGAI